MSFIDQGDQVIAIQGKDIELYVKTLPTSGVTVGWVADVAPYKILGAQNANPSAEQSESTVTELGSDVQKVLYGTVKYGMSISLLEKDKYQMAKLAGLDVATDTVVFLPDFNKVNLIVHGMDEDNVVLVTKIAGGWKARTQSSTNASDGNSTGTMEGSAECYMEFSGKATVRQHYGNGVQTCFLTHADVTADADVLAIENPAGTKLPTADYDPDGASKWVVFDTAPANKSVVRIYSIQTT